MSPDITGCHLCTSGRNRTGTPARTYDFESHASTNSATEAGRSVQPVYPVRARMLPVFRKEIKRIVDLVDGFTPNAILDRGIGRGLKAQSGVLSQLFGDFGKPSDL